MSELRASGGCVYAPSSRSAFRPERSLWRCAIPETNDFAALVIGGSLGGLAAAHELRAIGADVSVYERSVGPTPARGAGIVVQPEIEALLNRLGVPAEAVGVELHERQQLDVRGKAARHEAPRLMTAWDALHRVLREPLADVCHRLDGALRRVQVEGHEVTAEFSGGRAARGNFLVGADGIGSATRRLLDPSSRPAYAGYVAWRGLEPESRLSGELLELFSGRLTLFTSSGMQMLCSLVPGPDGELEKGSRRVNWVWYVNVAEQDLPGLLTGRSGRRFAHFLPPGEALPETVERVRGQAEASLPPALAELVGLSDLFMQPVHDVPPWRMVADHAALIGDAAGTVWPHIAAGASRAFGDAAGLATALLGWTPAQPLPAVALEYWEVRRLDHLVTLSVTGREQAAKASLGAGAGDTFFASPVP
ncbi:FAD-dependent monooxygenase [Streptomyces sp. NPDC088354]|uniref:FAD binding domain-containing protein n=1 Tax=Streptomyces sp. NPDC088354 TaxID=3365856 RepID=UPI00380497A4